MENKTELHSQYKKLLRYLLFYEYILECAEEEIKNNTGVVSDRVERLVIDKPEEFINKHFLLNMGESAVWPDDYEGYNEMLYHLLRQNYFRVLIWTDDNRGEAGEETIHVMKAGCLTKKLSVSAELNCFIKLFTENRRIKRDLEHMRADNVS